MAASVSAVDRAELLDLRSEPDVTGAFESGWNLREIVRMGHLDLRETNAREMLPVRRICFA
jgi:hypothetical protein